MFIQPRLFKDFRRVEELMKENGRGVWQGFAQKKLYKLTTELNSLKYDFEKAKKAKDVKLMYEIKRKADFVRKEIEFYGSK